MAFFRQQTVRSRGELVDRFALTDRRGAQCAWVTAPVEQLGVYPQELVPGCEEVCQCRTLGARELVDRPGGDRRLAQPDNALCLLTTSLATKHLRQNRALGNEALKRNAVEIARVSGRHRLILFRRAGGLARTTSGTQTSRNLQAIGSVATKRPVRELRSVLSSACDRPGT